MKEVYERILEKWFYSKNEKVVRLNDIKEIFEDTTNILIKPLDTKNISKGKDSLQFKAVSEFLGTCEQWHRDESEKIRKEIRRSKRAKIVLWNEEYLVIKKNLHIKFANNIKIAITALQ